MLLLLVLQLKQALWAGGISRSNKDPEKSSTPGLKAWSDLVGWATWLWGPQQLQTAVNINPCPHTPGPPAC